MSKRTDSEKLRRGVGLMLGTWVAALVIGIYFSWDTSSLWPMAFPVILVVYDLRRLMRAAAHLSPIGRSRK